MRFSALILAVLIGLSSFHPAEAKSKQPTYGHASRRQKKLKKYKNKKFKPGKFKAAKQKKFQKAKWGGKHKN